LSFAGAMPASGLAPARRVVHIEDGRNRLIDCVAARGSSLTVRGRKQALAALASLLALAGAGCTSNPGASIPTWAGGEPEGLPPRPPATASSFPDVHDLPPPRPTKLMSEREQTRLEAELTALRKRVNAKGATEDRDRPATQKR
jgi:hypothetical protein